MSSLEDSAVHRVCADDARHCEVKEERESELGNFPFCTVVVLCGKEWEATEG